MNNHSKAYTPAELREFSGPGSDRLRITADEIERLTRELADTNAELVIQARLAIQRRAALSDAVQLVEKLKVFGNDNVHRYDVPQWLERTKALLPGEPS